MISRRSHPCTGDAGHRPSAPQASITGIEGEVFNRIPYYARGLRVRE